jgi:HSP20 family protein
MAIMKWRPLGWGLRPWRSFDELHREMDRLFEDFLGRSARRKALEERVWAPAVDILDKKDKIVVRAEIPGVDKKDVKVTVEGDTLIIRGERKAEEKVKGEDYYACELSYGAFSRSIYLPVKVNQEKVIANFKNGILEVTIPKAKGAEPKEIEVSIK